MHDVATTTARRISDTASGAEQRRRGTPFTQREERRMHLHIVRVAAPNLKKPRPAKVIQLEYASQGAPRAGTARAVASPTGRLSRSRKGAARQVSRRRLPMRMWRNRDTHRSQKPAASAMRVRLPPSALPVARVRRVSRKAPRRAGQAGRRTPDRHAASSCGGRTPLPFASVAQSGRAPGFDPGRRGSTPLGGLARTHAPTRHRGRAARHAPATRATAVRLRPVSSTNHQQR